MNARLALVGAPDRTPHPSVQAWSRGEFFPAVIKRVEVVEPSFTHYSNALGVFIIPETRYTAFVVLYRGRESEPYSHYDDAHAVACKLATGSLDDRLDEVFA